MMTMIGVLCLPSFGDQNSSKPKHKKFRGTEFFVILDEAIFLLAT